MERLQLALEKARDRRAKLKADLARSALLDPPPLAAREAAWLALEPIETYRSGLERNRVVAFAGNADAAPYDVLRSRIIQQAHEYGWRRIALVSPDSGSGKTTTIANLAFSFARRRDLRTLVLDLDLRRPSLAAVLDQSIGQNMVDVFEGRVPFSRHGRRYGDNLAFGLNREAAPHSAELLQGPEAETTLAAIDAALRPDFTLFDLAPLEAGDDSYGFLGQCDCALMIVEAERTPIAAIDATERLLAERTQVMGIVLNKCNFVEDPYGPPCVA